MNKTRFSPTQLGQYADTNLTQCFCNIDGVITVTPTHMHYAISKTIYYQLLYKDIFFKHMTIKFDSYNRNIKFKIIRFHGMKNNAVIKTPR